MDGHALRRVLYLSTAVSDFGADALAALARASAEKNAARGITGVLFYNRGSFMQVIEGPTEAIDALLRAITGDPRHTFVQILIDEGTDRRMFRDWGMRLCDLGAGPPPAAGDFLTIAKFLCRTKLGDSVPVVRAFIDYFTDGEMLEVDPAAA